MSGTWKTFLFLFLELETIHILIVVTILFSSEQSFAFLVNPIWHGGGAETAHWFFKMLPYKNERAKLHKVLWLFLIMYGQPLERKKFGPNIFFCPLGGSQIFFGPPEKEYGKKNAGDTNFFLDKMII